MEVEVEKPMKPLLTSMPFKQHGIVEIASLVPIKRHMVAFSLLKNENNTVNRRIH